MIVYIKSIILPIQIASRNLSTEFRLTPMSCRTKLDVWKRKSKDSEGRRQTSDPRSGFATMKDFPGSLTPLLDDRKAT